MSENEKLPPPVNLKHRLLGAAVLVSAAVIFLPLIFSEREPPAELKSAGDAPKEAAPDAAPVPAAAPSEYALPAPAPEPAAAAPEKKPAAPAAEPAPVEAAPAAPKPAKGWVVQVGIFANAANAAKLADKLKTQGHDVLLEGIVHNGEKRQRLRVGPFADKAAAQQAQARIQQAHGIAGAVLSHP